MRSNQNQYTYPQLQLPTSPWTAVFRTCERILRNDPVIGPVTRTLACYRGEALDALAIGGQMPPMSLCPYIRLAPAPQESEWQTERQHKIPLILDIQVATAGTHIDELMNYWWAIQQAFFPQDADLRAQVLDLLQNCAADQSVTRPVLTLAGFGGNFISEADCILVAQGRINMNMLVRT